jgi:hypothetical protein
VHGPFKVNVCRMQSVRALSPVDCFSCGFDGQRLNMCVLKKFADQHRPENRRLGESLAPSFRSLSRAAEIGIPSSDTRWRPYRSRTMPPRYFSLLRPAHAQPRAAELSAFARNCAAFLCGYRFEKVPIVGGHPLDLEYGFNRPLSRSSVLQTTRRTGTSPP